MLSAFTAEKKVTGPTNVINFNVKIPTPFGVVYSIKIKRCEEMSMMGSDFKAEPKKINISEAHQKLGHILIAETK
jgi:hypothetical protein